MKASLAIMGIVVAGALAFSMPAEARHGQEGHHRMGQGICAEKLSPDKAKMVEDTMHRSMENNHADFERMRQLHEKMMAIGTADTFDRKAFLAAGDEMASLHMKMAKSRTRMMADVAGQLTAQERRDMAECLRGKFHHGMGGHGMGGGKTMDKHNDDSYNQ